MKSVIFTEEQLHNLDEIGKELFGDELDPRSITYMRKLKRPSISWLRIILHLLIPSLVLVVLIVGLLHCGVPAITTVVIASVVLLVYMILTLKRAVICAIKIYQRYAKESLRNKCRFEPSCSDYMLLAIGKYGLVKGLQKGINRLKRCNINGGGFDFL